MPSDTYILTISEAGVSVPSTNSVTNDSVAADAAISFSKLAPLSSGNIIVGNSSNVPTSVAVTGDVIISNTGITSIATGSIVNADINSSAGIAHSKLATTTAGNVLIGNAAGSVTGTPITGDISVSSTGAATINNNAVTLSKLQTVSDYQILGRNTGVGVGNVQSISCTPFAFSLLDDGNASTARTTLGLGSMATQDSSSVNITGGTISVDSLSFSTPLSATSGGTGQSSYAVGDLLYANTTTSVAKLADVATGNVLLSGGLNTAPSYGKVGLTTHVSGILPVANGGTGYGSDGIGTLSFDTTPDTGTALTEGQLRWNTTDKTLDLKMTGANVTQQIGQELLMRVHAGTTITNGDVVYISGSNAGLPSVSKASSGTDDSRKTLAVATEDIASGADGYVTLYGLVRGLNLSSYTAGQELWLSATAGAFTGTEPSYPNFKVRVGYVVTATDGTGTAYVSPRFYENGTVNGTGKIGYLLGSGGTVTQNTNKETGVTLNKTNGQITMHNESLAGGAFKSFTLSNTKIEAGDVLILNHISGGTFGSYSLSARCAFESATIGIRNVTNGALAEAVVIAFAVIKAVNA